MSSKTPAVKLHGQLGCIREEARRLLDGVALLRLTAILTLVTRHPDHAILVRQLGNHVGLPRAGVGRMFVQEVPARLVLLP